MKILIDGVKYPCRPTMGAMLRFKKETGKEITEITDKSFTELCTYLYCCVVSACAADKVDFSMPLLEFADALNPDDMNAWAGQMQQGITTDENAGEVEKKR